MKRILFTIFLFLATGFIYGQTTYYWVGGLTASTGINTGSNWNTVINGTGSSRPSSTGASDILVFDGTNLGGATPATGPATILASASITCAQIKFVNNVNITMNRPASGTSTITIAGELGEDFVVNAGCTFNVVSPIGSIRFALQPAVNACRVSGTVSLITPFQMRFDNGTTGTPGTFIFTSGSSFTTNITATSSSYAFGSSTQSSEKWVVFQSGAHLYYQGGWSPIGNSSTFSAIDFQPGSFWHHQVAVAGGSFFSNKSFGNIIVESGSTLAADGPIYRIGNLTVNTGCTFTTYTSGQTAIMGDLVVNGTLNAGPASTNEIMMAGNTLQTISGTGVINVPNLKISDNADVTLSKNITVSDATTVYGKMNFTDKQITGSVSFKANGINTPVAGTGDITTGSYVISNTSTGTTGQAISGAGIPANTSIVNVSTTNNQIYISNPATATATNVAYSVTTSGAALQTANVNGFNPATGSVVASGTMTFQNKISYTIDGATTWPFGITTGSSGNMIQTNTVNVNAPITVNTGVTINANLLINGKMTLRPADTVHLVAGAALLGAFGNTKYIAADYTAAGVQSIIQADGLASSTTIPLGTTLNYLPVTISPATASNFTFAAFEGITTDGLITGTPLSVAQKQQVVDAVWNINRLSGTGTASVEINWPASLEGSTFTTLPDTDIGLIKNNGSSWDLPVGTGNNTSNIVTGTASTFGSFGAGAVPQVSPFIFNPLPVKTYGNPDFNGGAISLNTTEPIIYASNNPAVATIVGGNIHIVGAGTADITASQASDGFYPPASVTRTLTVNPAALTVTADNKIKFEGQVNPTLTITYTGFVLGETSAVLLTQPTISTTATTLSVPGVYPITVSDATAANYIITHVNGTLTVQPKQNQTITFNAPPAKTYGNADFAHGATSTNNTIPITFTSSNPAVATVVGNNIHIVGAGTTNITASQAGNVGYFPAADVVRTLTVNKAALTIRVRDTVRNFGTANPPFTITYTGFVLGETAANLLTQVNVNSIATITSAPGYYTLTPADATSNNYAITFTAGRLTILPPTGTDKAHINVYMSSKTAITVRLYSPKPALADILIYNMNGQFLMKKNVFMPAGFISTDMNISALPAGIYSVKVIGSGVDLQRTTAIIK